MEKEVERKRKQKTKAERKSKFQNLVECPVKGRQQGIKEAFKKQKGRGKRKGIG